MLQLLHELLVALELVKVPLPALNAPDESEVTFVKAKF